MPVGVISHLENPDFPSVRALAQAAQAAGADWLGLPDAFWWRDAWLLLAEAARATRTIPIGPLVTKPYMRHPFHTLAALASLQELAGPERVFVGIGAGGSEVSGAAGISRRDAKARVRALVHLQRRVERGEPLDPESGRSLELALEPAPVLPLASSPWPAGLRRQPLARRPPAAPQTEPHAHPQLTASATRAPTFRAVTVQ